MERFAVIGLGRFGSRLAALLTESGAEVIAVDRRRELVEEIRDRVSVAVCLDSVDAEALRAQGIDKVDVAVVGIGADFEASALTTAVLKQIGVPRVISRATTNTRGEILARIGADDVVNPEKESAERWANRLVAPAVMERHVLAEGYSLVQMAAPESFFHKTLGELRVASRYKVHVVAIKRKVSDADSGRPPQTVISVPLADAKIEPEDILLLIGNDEAIMAFPTK